MIAHSHQYLFYKHMLQSFVVFIVQNKINLLWVLSYFYFKM